jgi:hypothetical protein
LSTHSPAWEIPVETENEFGKLNSFVLAGFPCATPLSATPSFAQDSAAAPSAPIKNVVLDHGRFANGSSWQKVIGLLQAKDLHVTLVRRSKAVLAWPRIGA